MKHAARIQLFLLLLMSASVSLATEDPTSTLIADVHANPPRPCVAKAIGDMSSGMAIFPDGKDDEQLRGVMGWMASVFLAKGGELVTPQNVAKVYTAVFYEGRPIDEVGIYGYEFAVPIESRMFEANEELTGRLFVLDGNMLFVLWHERLEKTARCFNALEKVLNERQ